LVIHWSFWFISRDRYLKRDELGVIFQLCVAPGRAARLIGAALVREVFERSAYGCKLYCCWCAQDLDANYFWESLGFVPIAFRAGSDKKQRVHIFWQSGGFARAIRRRHTGIRAARTAERSARIGWRSRSRRACIGKM
jgi:GNAT superfamily N-acetyltransferase